MQVQRYICFLYYQNKTLKSYQQFESFPFMIGKLLKIKWLNF